MKSKFILKFCFVVFFTCLLIFTSNSFCQNANTANPGIGSIMLLNVKGQILSAVDKKPILHASVFLNNATIGAETDNNGNFQLKNINPGNYTLIVSIIGFETYSQNITLSNASLSLSLIYLIPKTTVLAEVTIKSDANSYPDWYYEVFNKEFLGTSDMAKDTKIVNPEMLDFKYDENSKMFSASSSGYLKIKNYDLGYEIKYGLNDFKWDNSDTGLKYIHYEGSAFFTEMQGSNKQQKNWERNRLDVYNASKTHFFRALLSNQLDNEGFKVYTLVSYNNPERPSDSIIASKIKLFDALNHEKLNHADADSLAYWKHKFKLPKTLQRLFDANKHDLTSMTDQKGVYRFASSNFPVLVIYNKKHRFPDIKQLNNLGNLNYIINKPDNTEFSFIEFAEPFGLIDEDGGIINPNSLVFRGAWVNARIADLLPINYEPPARDAENEISSNDTVMLSQLAKLNKAAELRPVEKVYLHLDKSYYLPGDTIWAKVYTVSGSLHQLSVLSGIAHCEMIDVNGVIVNSHILKLNNGLALVDYPLSLATAPGVYHIRAYTNWMRNDDAGYFFDSPITIGALKTDTINKQIVSSINTNPKFLTIKPDVQFLPEGGNMVYGVRSKIGFKAISASGYGIAISGVVLDNDGNEVTTFTTTHLGMGVFNLTPVDGKTYKANITYANNEKLTIDLPVPRSEGFAMAITLKDSVIVKVGVNKKFLKQEENSVFYIVAQSGGKVYYSAKEVLKHLVYTAVIPKTQFPVGIVKFTLFSQRGEPLNERNVFIDNKQDLINIRLTASSKKYRSGEKVIINVDTQPENDLPSQGSFSVSVINTSRVPVNENTESTILNNLLLTSDIKGYVENPNYYFNNVNDKTNGDLDILMLTQAYERYSWKDVLNNYEFKPVSWQPENAISISGILKTPGGKPVPRGRIDLLATPNNFIKDTVADVNGKFKFSDVELPDSAVIVLKALKQSGNADAVINLDNDIPKTRKYINNADTTDLKIQPQIKKYFNDYIARQNYSLAGKGIQLQEVKVKGVMPVKKPVLAYSSNLNGPGNADQVIMGSDLGNCIDLSDCLNGKVFGVRFVAGLAYNNRNAARLIAITPKNKKAYYDVLPPLAVIVDGIIVGGKGDISDVVNVSDIYSIEIIRSGKYGAIYGSEAFSGAIIITTKRGSENTRLNKVSSGLLTYRFNGYYNAHEFYNPKYVVPQNAQNASDYRSTIYWNPNVITDKQGKASFGYFNAATKGTYSVVIEGIDNNNKIGRQVFTYNVE